MYRQGPAENERYDETAQRGARFGGAGKKALVPPADRLGDDQKPAGGGGRADDHRGLQKDAVGSGALHGAPTTPPAATAHKSRSSDDSLDGLLDDLPRLKAGSRAAKEGQGNAYRDQPNVNGKFAPPPPPRAPPAAEPQGEGARKAAPSAKRAIADNPLDGLDLDVPRTRRAPPPKPAQDKAVEDDSVNKSDGLGSGVAQRAAPAPRHEPAAKRPAIVAAAPAAEAPATTPAPGAAPPAPAAPPPAPAPAKSSVAYNADAEELAAPQESEAKSTKKEKKQSTAKGGPAETLAQRADRLFAAGRWSEAVEAYRELLRRDPHNDDADRWRRRLVAAESADTSQGNASVAERRAAEVKRAAPPASAAKPTRAPAKAKASAVDSAEQ
jgi:hypothetical protein